MPRFFGKKGPRGGSRAGVKQRPKKNAPRRRLQPGLAIAGGLAVYGAKKVWDKRTRDYKKARTQAKRVFESRVAQTDNIAIAPSIVIGKQRVLSFQEKVARTVRPPFLFKRNYQWSSECLSGRKGMFSIEINPISANDLLQDITTYKGHLYTNTASADSSAPVNGLGDGAQFYVDRLVEKLSLVNSSSNSITGKMTLISYKRDVAGNYSTTGAVLQPIPMAMYYSSQSLTLLALGGVGGDAVGNGWAFDNATAGLSFATGYQMPGSSINTGGATASVDPAFGLFSPHIKERMNFWFKAGRSQTFSLKPGQQIDQTMIFNDLPVLHRELQEYSHVPGISFSLVVEFTGGIVGDNTAVTGNNIISSGTCQLSCIRTSSRTLGVKNYLKPNVLLQTAPMNQILTTAQVIINSDTGVALSGAVIDA